MSTRNRYEAIGQILVEWDPIGIRGMPGAQDEYDAYVPEVARLISGKPSAEEVFSYLWELETGHMGLVGNEAVTREFARRILTLL